MRVKLFTEWEGSEKDGLFHIFSYLFHPNVTTIINKKQYLCGKEISDDKMPLTMEFGSMENLIYPRENIEFNEKLCPICKKLVDENYPKDNE